MSTIQPHQDAPNPAPPGAPKQVLRTLPEPPSDAPLTRVSLAYVEHRFKLYLRFGQPAREVRLNRWRHEAAFLQAATFCRIRWEANDYGTIRWQLLVLRACMHMDGVQRIPGIRPGARILLRAEGERQVMAVLQKIDAIETLGIDPAEVAPAYWGTLGNRLAARLPLPSYTAQRHAAWLAGRELR